MKLIIAGIIILSFLSACGIMETRKYDGLLLEEKKFSNLKGWAEPAESEYSKIGAMQAFLKSCFKFYRGTDNIELGKFAGKMADWITICQAAETVYPIALEARDENMAKSFFERYFAPHLVTNMGAESGLFTGYYEIDLEGSRTKKGNFIYPIYKRPAELKEGEKFFTREEIDKGALIGKNLELIYVNDRVRLFFLHIQGSGQIKLDDGSIVKIGFAGKNNHDYTAIGAYMRRQGYLEGEITADKIKAWLYENQERFNEVTHQNKSYIFFHETTEDIPIGAQGVGITPMHSIAVDNSYIPYGVPLWVETTLPATKFAPDKNFYNLMIAQDTGSAIRGPVRGDIFFGAGEQAEALAQNMKSFGSYYVLLPKIPSDENLKISMR